MNRGTDLFVSPHSPPFPARPSPLYRRDNSSPSLSFPSFLSFLLEPTALPSSSFCRSSSSVPSPFSFSSGPSAAPFAHHRAFSLLSAPCPSRSRDMCARSATFSLARPPIVRSPSNASRSLPSRSHSLSDERAVAALARAPAGPLAVV